MAEEVLRFSENTFGEELAVVGVMLIEDKLPNLLPENAWDDKLYPELWKYIGKLEEHVMPLFENMRKIYKLKPPKKLCRCGMKQYHWTPPRCFICGEGNIRFRDHYTMTNPLNRKAYICACASCLTKDSLRKKALADFHEDFQTVHFTPQELYTIFQCAELLVQEE